METVFKSICSFEYLALLMFGVVSEKPPTAPCLNANHTNLNGLLENYCGFAYREIIHSHEKRKDSLETQAAFCLILILLEVAKSTLHEPLSE